MKTILGCFAVALLLLTLVCDKASFAKTPLATSAFTPRLNCAQPTSDGWMVCHNGDIPAGITAQGMDEPAHLPLWVCKANFASPGKHPGTHPGKIRFPFHGCHISYGGLEYEIPDYQILFSPVTWTQSQDGQVPAGDTLGGQEGPEDGGQLLLVCKTMDNDIHGVQLGKIRPEFHACLFPYGGREIAVGLYSVASRQ